MRTVSKEVIRIEAELQKHKRLLVSLFKLKKAPELQEHFRVLDSLECLYNKLDSRGNGEVTKQNFSKFWRNVEAKKAGKKKEGSRAVENRKPGNKPQKEATLAHSSSSKGVQGINAPKPEAQEDEVFNEIIDTLGEDFNMVLGKMAKAAAEKDTAEKAAAESEVGILIRQCMQRLHN
jgi:hypothetical protein